jgi:hypothetical protein
MICQNYLQMSSKTVNTFTDLPSCATEKKLMYTSKACDEVWEAFEP